MDDARLPLAEALEVICPMHLLVDATGHVAHAGPTMRKLCGGSDPRGSRFLELFELRRPKPGATMAELRAVAGRKLHLRMRAAPRTDVKGVLWAIPETGAMEPRGGLLVNLSFGISVVEAIRDFSLTSGDFAATDLTIEMLYLIEAKAAAMEASRLLNLRLQGAKIAAEEQAFTDRLTGLRNRRALDHVLGQLAGAEQDFAMVHLDLDHFKAVNDTYGHAAGDHVLREVARIMRQQTRADDTLVRTGGDEFVLILARLTEAERVHDIASRIIARLEEPIAFGGRTCRISASAGSALSCDYARPERDVARMMADADAALYAAKAAGRGRHVSFTEGLRQTGADRAWPP
ncbi:GGDEF domain-containing protein [Roseovarius sp. SCSIO 43702]|uniref:GGDEF domain-containing protein n=1 Tax=Roseovarius sp. SCSIO 43702 TaxID=2823043 RepID=UPI001C72D449|nr:GGDEF domain-containing protein [Roseovarius sp. SCSIO 43702]QYX57930.1 GGDEF domain-containing protein [Roseovarius sp. SCSIO 43702]